MTIESQLAQLQQAATEQTEASVQLANNITEGLQEIDQVKQDIAQTYQTVNQNNQALNDWQTQSGSVNLKDLNGNSHTLPTLKSLIADAQSVNPHPHVMTKAQFDALRDMRKQQYAGSGFIEWGKHNYHSNNVKVNEGIWQYVAPSAKNKLIMGEAASNRIAGISNTIYPVVNIDGVTHHVSKVAHTSTQSILKFPFAPDGTKTYDSASGTVTQHNNAEAAFAAETETNKVITSRKDLVFLESWHEKIADKDVVYPLGNVQYGANHYKGIVLRNNLVTQGYSAFGEWDTGTKGHGIKWSSLTESQKATFLGEPEHNIYYDPKAKAYIQVRYRVRVVEGLGDNWGYIADFKLSPTGPRLQYDGSFNRVKPRGKLAGVMSDLRAHNSGPSGFFVGGNMQESYGLLPDKGCLQAINKQLSAVDIAIAEQGKCFALPIALVQRLNQGAYHPSYNPMGTTQYTMTGVRNYHWYELPTSLRMSTLGCFIQPTETSIGKHPGMGYIGGHGHSRADQYKYHDAIYAGQVEDLRLSAKKQDFNALREETMRKAVAGTLRGKEKIPFTYFEHRYGVELARPATYNQINAGGSIEFKISAGQPVLDAYLSEPNNIGYYVYNQKGDSIYISKLIASPINYVNWPYSGNDKVTCYIYGVENKVEEFNSTFSIGDTLFIGALRQLSCEFDTLPWVDIIGSPENIAATFPDGVVGQWIPQIPDGTSKSFSLNKKAENPSSWVLTNDNGNIWSAGSLAFDYVKNVYVSPAEETRVQLLNYKTASTISQAADNTSCRSVGEVFANSNYLTSRGARLMESLTDRFSISGQGNGETKIYPLSAYTLDYDLGAQDIKLMGRGSRLEHASPKHPQIDLIPPLYNSKAFKALDSIVEKNGLFYLQFHGSELQYQNHDVQLANSSISQSYTKGKVYRFSVGEFKGLVLQALTTLTGIMQDVTYINEEGELVGLVSGNVVFKPVNAKGSWGDDQTIPIIDGENTKTDLNGNTVKVFCHHTLFPIGIAHNG
ncbi:hypothetical protein [Pseudoalteromonas sp. A757]|uniref:hypothetical protein n=1 Tax=Pseudoalteromonas sp. A757 TaxID=2250709 RepID=UPI000FFE54BE|nr:hypothetical protein [Pseudoalteromonas sp. A757]RXE85498.1 hypothetical protein DRB05_17300 [Pseudoalteromonas sp. A757]